MNYTTGNWAMDKPQTRLRKGIAASRGGSRKAAVMAGKEAPPPLIGFPGMRHKTCQWIDGDPRIDSTMCGKPTVKDSEGRQRPYCAEHEARVWRSGSEAEKGGPHGFLFQRKRK